MRAQERVIFSNFTATQGPFVLQGGYYNLSTVSSTLSGSNHVDVTQVGPDGSTAIVALAGAQTGTTYWVNAYLPPGAYSITVTGTLTGIYASLTRIPIE